MKRRMPKHERRHRERASASRRDAELGALFARLRLDISLLALLLAQKTDHP